MANYWITAQTLRPRNKRWRGARTDQLQMCKSIWSGGNLQREMTPGCTALPSSLDKWRLAGKRAGTPRTVVVRASQFVAVNWNTKEKFGHPKCLSGFTVYYMFQPKRSLWDENWVCTVCKRKAKNIRFHEGNRFLRKCSVSGFSVL